MAILAKIGEELLEMYANDKSDADLQRYCLEKHKLIISRRALQNWRNEQLEARGIVSLKAIAPKLELVMGREVDELLKFKGFCLDTALRIWRSLPAAEKNTARNAFKFLEAYQKAVAQVFVLHGISEAAKAGQTMDDISARLTEKFDKLSAALNSADEDTQPSRNE